MATHMKTSTPASPWASVTRRPLYSYRYSLRLGTVEPVFADINHATGLRRFSLRGRRKVNAQWMMYCLAHNIGKIQRYGDIGRWKKERKVEIRQ